MALFSKPTARALAIIDLLMANPHQSFGLTDITRRLNLNKATCHAILTTMSTYGFLVQDSKSKAYRLGPSIAAAGHAAFAQFPVLEYARPELEKLTSELGMGCGAIGRSGSHIVLLAHYRTSAPFESPFQMGLRLPNIAPLGACFIAWSPANQLQQWLDRSHNSRGEYHEKFDQSLRISVIAIHSRGFEVTLKTSAEATLGKSLAVLNENWSLDTLEKATNTYQQTLCDEPYHLDRIDPKRSYDVCNISVPVFGYSRTPELTFTVGSITQALTGAEILDIAERLKEASLRVTKAARETTPGVRMQ
ncbi:IclR family transcriptional regulator [Oceanicoccus sp. KOV_DT_Chl]|uniref:IclR family transcriptional regulator n=1 Tax=Oceanicoccus sp. KOV_DT_Chl TaxID=1904639 RepID=UPI000C7C5828|nr:helix-turn-helix domain-containing protein [Oceanicoccus sp. KOV_DT_Chl]